MHKHVLLKTAEASKERGNGAKSPHSASYPRRQHPDSFELKEKVGWGAGGGSRMGRRGRMKKNEREITTEGEIVMEEAGEKDEEVESAPGDTNKAPSLKVFELRCFSIFNIYIYIKRPEFSP